MSMWYECDECGHSLKEDGFYAPAREGDPVPPILCPGCGGKMDYVESGGINPAPPCGPGE